MWELATRVVPVPWSTPVPQVEEALRTDATLPGVAVRATDGSVHLIGRVALDLRLTGRLGFGRLLLARHHIGELVGGDTLRLDADTDAEVAAQRALDRPEGNRADDVLVTWPDGRVGIARLERLLTHLAGRYADLAHHDPLTGLGNRRVLATDVPRVLAEPDRSVALFLLDLDRFKEINDALGHDAGDELLRHVGDALRRAPLAGATVVRVSGDEFVVVAHDVARLFPDEVAELPVVDQLMWTGRALRTLVHGPFTVGGVRIGVEASVGVACAPEHGRDLSTLLRRADAAMYDAKRHRAGVRVWHDDIAMPLGEDLQILTELRTAVAEGQLRLYYQPQVDGATEQVRAVEALLRWQHPVRGLLPPAAFLPQAEVSDVVVDLTDWVVNEAVAQAAAWLHQGRPVPVSVNVSAACLADDRLVDVITAALTRHGLPAALLTVEVTESLVMTEPVETARRLSAIRELGVRISVDDFGAGYTSLALLAELPIDELKVDRGFITRMDASPAHVAIVAAVAAMAGSLNLTLVGEGIEDLATAHTLRDMGFHLLQGYYFGKPQPPESLSLPIAYADAPIRGPR
ncbi:EAL domain-containing protein [Planosporangium thailandense]|uniref:EAL domain-containing protein n=1 Tax=Planosporangium thailandense TaxID=765197 RepID=A0ABX0XZF4_9ACTN|nr:EAL domain-containing protein [Planosporangium thailandense]NJC71460.1 EAL domain-containing protein [Planosporangium thailandense]